MIKEFSRVFVNAIIQQLAYKAVDATLAISGELINKGIKNWNNQLSADKNEVKRIDNRVKVKESE